jgi:cysteinyl-tRNA synthetase
MAPIRPHDTRSGELRALVPRPDGRVGIYACGPTVYGRIHVGNARSFVVSSLLKRLFELEGPDAAGNYAEADRIRDELRARSWKVRDGSAGPELVGIER